MNTVYLKEFIVLAETRNFWEASERLYMNQSTLSKHIKALEQDLHIPLFERTTRRVTLSSYGEIFLPYAKAIVHAELEGISAIRRQRNRESGLLTIASVPSMPQYHITRFLSQFRKEHPDLTVKITEDDPSNLFNYLMNESCEVVFSRENSLSFEKSSIHNSQICRIPFASDTLVALVPKTHPFAGERSISLHQLKDERFCLIKEGSLMYQICVDACRNAGFIPNVIFTSHRIDSILDMVTNQECVALLMDKHIELQQSESAQSDALWCTLPISPEIHSQISLCYRTDRSLSPVAQEFVDFCTGQILDGNTYL